MNTTSNWMLLTTTRHVCAAFRPLAPVFAAGLALLAQPAAATTYDVFPVATAKPNWPSAAQWQTIPGLVASAANTGLTGNKARLDFVGDATYPTAYYAADANYVYFRARIKDPDPAYPTGSVWNDNLMVLLDKNADNVPDYAFSWDTAGGFADHQLELNVPAVANVVTASTAWDHVHMDDRDGTSSSKVHPDFNTLPGHTDDGYVRFVGAQAGPAGANTTTFVDYAVKWAYLTGTDTVDSTAISSLAPGQTWRVQFASMATGTDHANVSADVAGTATLSTTLTTAGAWSGSISPNNLTYIWTGGAGGGDLNWNTAANWDAGAVPVNGCDVIFPAVGPTLVNPANNMTGLSLRSVTITGSGYTIAGNAVSLSAGFTNSSGALSAFNCPLTLTAAQTFDLTGNTTFAGTIANNYALTVISAAEKTSEFQNSISGTGGLTKSGTGTLTLGAVNGYNGATTVNVGKLLVSGSAASSAVTVNSGGTLGGIGTVGSLDVKSGGHLAPGVVLGTLSAGNTTWEGGGNYDWQINDARGTAGTAPGWDLLNISGTLTTSASSGSKFTIKLVTLTGSTAGDAVGFDNTHRYAWPIATASGSIVGFAANKFTVDTTGFTSNPTWVDAGTFSVEQYGNSVYVVYSPTCARPAIQPILAPVDDGVRTYLTMTFECLPGLSAARASKMLNCTVTCTAYNEAGGVIVSGLSIPDTSTKTALPPGTTKVDVIASRPTSGPTATVNTFAEGVGGCAALFGTSDPSLVSLFVKEGGTVTQRLEGVPSVERYLRVFNGCPGLTSLAISVNGQVLPLTALVAGGYLALDLGAFMAEGEDNTVVFTGTGEVGASAFIVLADSSAGAPLSVAPSLAITLTPAGVELSWAEVSALWQLQASQAIGAAWENVVAAPVVQGGRYTVALSLGAESRFFRLQAVSTAAAASGPAQGSSARLSGTNSQSTLNQTYDAITW